MMVLGQNPFKALDASHVRSPTESADAKGRAAALKHSIKRKIIHTQHRSAHACVFLKWLVWGSQLAAVVTVVQAVHMD